MLCLTETKAKIETAKSLLFFDFKNAYKLKMKKRIVGVSDVGLFS